MNTKQTSPKVASTASKVLRNGNFSKASNPALGLLFLRPEPTLVKNKYEHFSEVSMTLCK